LSARRCSSGDFEKMSTIGIDEAGRGSVFGPLVIALVEVDSIHNKVFRKFGVTDSKLLTPERRSSLAGLILNTDVYADIRQINPKEIDLVVGQKVQNLNWLEAELMAHLIYEFLSVTSRRPQIIIDCPDVITSRFTNIVRLNLPLQKVRIKSEHHADLKYLPVSAASIIAKVKRDDAMDTLRLEYGNLGSGYPSDPITREFLKNLLLEAHGDVSKLPEYVRKSWKTNKKLNPFTEKELNTSLGNKLM